MKNKLQLLCDKQIADYKASVAKAKKLGDTHCAFCGGKKDDINTPFFFSKDCGVVMCQLCGAGQR